ncbi:MAG TPA: SPOR domain-containing protein, partial [Longimicrobiaceae bacterium]|nr:SPOR domain-containing protein [Longimicrobiaceae bacterium]
ALLEALEECETSSPAPVTGGWSSTSEGGGSRTVLARTADRSTGAEFAQPLPGRLPPVAAPAAAPPEKGDSPGASPAPPQPRSVLWLSVAGLAVLLPLSFLLLTRGPPGSERDPGPGVESEPRGASSQVGLAREEAQRVRERHGAREGDTLWVVVLASFGVGDTAQAREVRDRLRERGHEVGLANSLVYPELRDGYVALVAGPYERARAPGELERLRGTVAGDAFLMRVTLRAP